MTSFAESPQTFASFVQEFTAFQKSYPTPQNISLQDARKGENFDVACTELDYKLLDLETIRVCLTSLNPHPLLLTESFYLGNACTDSYRELLAPYKKRQQAGRAYTAFCGLASSPQPEQDFALICNAIGTLSEKQKTECDARGKNPDKYFRLKCPEFGYGAGELTPEVHGRMAQAHHSLAQAQASELARTKDPLGTKRDFTSRLATCRYWGGEKYDTTAVETAFNAAFPQACMRTARTEAIALMEAPTGSIPSGASKLEYIETLASMAGLENIRGIFNPTEKIGGKTLTAEECAQNLVTTAKEHDTRNYTRNSAGQPKMMRPNCM